MRGPAATRPRTCPHPHLLSAQQSVLHSAAKGSLETKVRPDPPIASQVLTNRSQRIRPLNWALSRGGRPFPGGVLHGWRVLHTEERRQAGVTTPHRPEEGDPRAMREGSSESLTLAQGTEATQAGRLGLPASLDPHTHPMLGARCSISQRGKGGQQGGFAPPQPRAATFPGFPSQGDFCRPQAPPKGTYFVFRCVQK